MKECMKELNNLYPAHETRQQSPVVYFSAFVHVLFRWRMSAVIPQCLAYSNLGIKIYT